MILLCLGAVSASQSMEEAVSETADEAVSVENYEQTEYVNDSADESLAVQNNEDLISEEEEGIYLDPTEAYECLNAYRAEKGAWFWASDNEHIYYFNTHDENQLKPLEIDPELEKTAKIRAKEISILFEHERPDGTSCFTIYPDEGYWSLGENIARFYPTGKDATEAWKENYLPFSEQGHRRSMLNPDFNCVGIAGYYSPYAGFFWVQAFGQKIVDVNETEKQFNLSISSLTDLANLIKTSSEIKLEKDYAYNGSEIKDGIVIDKNIVIDGDGHSIDGGKLARIFNITAENVILKNLKLINGYVDNDYGGAILSTCNNLTLINCSFINNFAYYGGAVSTTGDITLTGCELKDNLAVEGTVYSDGGYATLKDSDFSGNHAILYGGAVSLKNCYEVIENCTFTDNTAYEGAGIYSKKSEGYIKDSIFERNTAEVQGGAMHLNSAIDIENCIFTKNIVNSNIHPQEGGGAIFLNASGATIKKSSFTDNSGNLYGGAVFLIMGDVTIEDSTFTNNHLTPNYSNHGGAIHSNGNVNIMNCNFENNSADNGGVLSSNGGNICITNSKISKSSAENGGALSVTNTYVELENIQFNHNSGENGGVLKLDGNSASIKNCEFLNNTAEIGGCLYLSGDEFTITNCNFTDNHVNTTWVANGAAAYILKGKTTVEDSCFINNTANSEEYATYGGALFLSSINADFKYCIFKLNNAWLGGDIYSTESDVSCTSCDFSHSNSHIGASLYSTKGNLTVSDCDFYSNDLACGSIYSENGNVSVTDSKFYNNTARNGGGAIYTSNSNLNVWDCSFENNTPNSFYGIEGGSIYSIYGNVNIINSNFTDGVSVRGGALNLNQATITIEKCIFKNNTATDQYGAYGGAIYIDDSDTNIKSCVFKDNNVNASYYAEGGSIYSINTKLSIKDSSFIKNIAGISASNGNIEIGNCQFEDETGLEGGSVSLKNCNASIVNSRFLNCAAQYYGGGVYSESSNTTVSDSVFNNCSSNYGGAVFSQNGKTTLMASNFTDNNALYGGASYGCDAVDCVFTKNYAEVSSGAMYGESNTAENCRFIENTAFNENPTKGITEKNCIYTGNKLLKRGYFDTYYFETVYTQNDMMYLYLRFENYDIIYNAIITAEVYDNDEVIKTFDFKCEDGLKIKIEPGEYVFKFSVENQDYVVEPVNVTITVLEKEIAEINIEIENITYPEPVSVKILSNVDGIISIFIDDNYADSEDVIANKITSKAFSYINAGKHTVKVIIYPSNGNIDSETFTQEFEVYKKQTNIILEVEDITTDDSAVIKVTSSDDGTVSVELNGIQQNTYVTAGKTSEIEFGNLNAGSYDVTARFSAGENYIDSKDSKTLKVLSKITQENIEIIIPENSNTLAINLPEDAGGKITITVAGENYTADVVNGKVNIELPDFTGENPYTITYSGDGKYSGFEISGKLNDDKSTVKQDMGDVEFDDVKNIILANDAQGTITLTINGKDYVFDVVNGVSNIEMPELEDGSYSYTITYSGDDKYSSFTVTKDIVIKNPVNYKISASNLKSLYSSGQYYTIKVTGSNLKTVNGIKAVIKVNDKKFTTLTVKNGACKFKISQVPGTYTLNISVGNNSVIRTLTVKHLVTVKTVTVKKSAKKLVLSATLAKVNKKYLKGKTITFKFNGKKYTAKTNNKGVAKVTIKSSVLKKLKVGKKVTYQATYLKDTVKKTVKVKK